MPRAQQSNQVAIVLDLQFLSLTVEAHTAKEARTIPVRNLKAEVALFQLPLTDSAKLILFQCAGVVTINYIHCQFS